MKKLTVIAVMMLMSVSINAQILLEAKGFISDTLDEYWVGVTVNNVVKKGNTMKAVTSLKAGFNLRPNGVLVEYGYFMFWPKARVSSSMEAMAQKGFVLAGPKIGVDSWIYNSYPQGDNTSQYREFAGNVYAGLNLRAQKKSWVFTSENTLNSNKEYSTKNIFKWSPAKVSFGLCWALSTTTHNTPENGLGIMAELAAKPILLRVEYYEKSLSLKAQISLDLVGGFKCNKKGGFCCH